MNNNIKELFLTEYFKQVAAIGKFCDKTTFDLLAETFLLPREEAEVVWKAVGEGVVAEVVTLEDANRYKRILQLGALNNTSLPVSEENNNIISIKSNAIAEMSSIDMCAERNATASQVLQRLHAHALQGYTSVMYIWGTIQCEGNDALCVERCFEKGVFNIEKAAHWGHIPAILTLLHYLNNKDKYPVSQIKHSAKYYSKLLCTFAVNTPYQDLLSVLNIKDSEHSSNARLLLELFAQRKIKTEIFDKSIAKVVYADTIGAAAKEKLLSDTDVNAITELAALPMHLLRGTFEPDRQFWSSLPFVNREAEREALLREINRMGDFFFEQTKPFCFCSQDRFVLDAYRQSFEKMEIDGPNPQHVVTIDVGELSDADIQPNAENVFVTNCKNNARNLYLLVLQGNVSASKISAVKNFLQSNKRAKFKLSRPSVTLDLSPIVSICFCDKQNADKLSDVVNIGVTASLSSEERQYILKQRIQDVHCRCDNMPLYVNDSDIGLLSRYPLDVALMALDKLYQDSANGTAKDKRDISFYIADAEKSHDRNRGYGFGG